MNIVKTRFITYLFLIGVNFSVMGWSASQIFISYEKLIITICLNPLGVITYRPVVS